MSFYSIEELKMLGLKKYGKNVFISRKCSLYSPEKIEIGDNVRIDDFCILSGKIEIGSHIHISPYTALYGGGGIKIGDFVTISSRCALYSVSDDYSGEALTNPMINSKYRKVEEKEIILEKHCIIGTNSTILPGVVMKEGTSLGAHSLLKKDTEEWSVYIGVPAKKLRRRSRNLLQLEKEFLKDRSKV